MQKCDIRKIHFVKKVFLKWPLQTGTIGKDTQSELKRVLFRGMHVPKKTASRDLINAKTFENRRIAPREGKKKLFFRKTLPLFPGISISIIRKGEGNQSLPPIKGVRYNQTMRKCPQRSSGADARTSGRKSHLHQWGWRWSWSSSLRRQRRGRRGAGRS